jgi:hypothetical protein
MVREARALGVLRFVLDVFVSNARAREWYERLGMEREFDRSFWIGPIMGAVPAPPFVTPDFPQADIIHGALGFSELTVEQAGKAARVGRLGSRFFRVVGGELALDEKLRGCLAAIDPSREILAILEGDAGIPSSWRKLVVARRMSVVMEGLRL